MPPDPSPKRPTRRERHRADARREILEAAEQILVEDGYDGFSMRKLALRCGCTAPTLYHYFGDKTRLIDALLEERLAQLVTLLRRVPEQHDPVENLRALSRAWVAFGLDSPAHYSLVTQPRSPDLEPLASGERARQILEKPVDELAARGRLAIADVETVRQSMWAHLHGLISLRASRPDVPWCDDLIDQSIEAMLRGWVLDEPRGH